MENRKKSKNKTFRQHCEFNDCNCKMFIGEKGNRCKFCQHGDVWHHIISQEKREKKLKECLDDYPS